NLTLPSSPPAATALPSGLNVRSEYLRECPARSWTFPPLSTSHRTIVPSVLAEARSLPSGLNATDHTGAEWPSRVGAGARGSEGLHPGRSQRRTVRSWLPEASVRPSGLTATLSTVA